MRGGINKGDIKGWGLYNYIAHNIYYIVLHIYM
ncbi:hypothetical protein [Staphylococcus phage PT1-1]